MRVKQNLKTPQSQFLSAFNKICIPYLHRCFLFSNFNKSPVKMYAVLCSHMLCPSSLILQFWSASAVTKGSLKAWNQRLQGWCHAQTSAEYGRLCGHVTAMIYWRHGRRMFIPGGSTVKSKTFSVTSQLLKLYIMSTVMRWTVYCMSKWIGYVTALEVG